MVEVAEVVFSSAVESSLLTAVQTLVNYEVFAMLLAVSQRSILGTMVAELLTLVFLFRIKLLALLHASKMRLVAVITLIEDHFLNCQLQDSFSQLLHSRIFIETFFFRFVNGFSLENCSFGFVWD